MNKEKNNETEINESLKPFYKASVIIVFIWISSVFIIGKFYSKISEKGAFGDSFGAVNALFSGIALAGIIYTMNLQRKELKLQRKELIENRKELARTAKAQEESEIALRRQAENLKITAKLNALTGMVEHYDQRMNRNPGTRTIIEAKQKIYLAEIERIIESKHL